MTYFSVSQNAKHLLQKYAEGKLESRADQSDFVAST